MDKRVFYIKERKKERKAGRKEERSTDIQTYTYRHQKYRHTETYRHTWIPNFEKLDPIYMYVYTSEVQEQKQKQKRETRNEKRETRKNSRCIYVYNIIPPVP